MKKIFTIAIAALGLIAVSSCDDFLDINYNPNSPSADVVDNNMVLPAAEMALASQYGNFYRILGGYFAQQYCQTFGTSNYVDYSRFLVSSTRTNSAYSTMMTGCIANATVVKEKAAAAEEWGTYLAATTLRVFAFQALVDAYGEIPYSEAMDSENLNPKFDDGKDIYAGLVAELEDALAKASSSSVVATNFLYSGETADNWIKFANALELKLLSRESGVTDVNSKIGSIISSGNLPSGDVAFNCYLVDASGKCNPFYQEEFATYFGSNQINCGLNVALYRAMSDYGDARLAAFFTANGNDEYWGGISGTNISTSNNYKAAQFCRPAIAFNTPVSLISKSEIEFFISEYYAKSGNAAAAKEHYEAAVNASFDAAGVEGASAALAAYPYDQSNFKKCIGVQKWIALSGINNFEAWCEARRLGYPEFDTATSGDKIYSLKDDKLDETLLTPGCLYTPIDFNPEVGANALAQRWPYALSSLNYNSNAPAAKPQNAKIFWAN